MPSKNDIFNASWHASPPPSLLPPAAALHTSSHGLGRSKTTGAVWNAQARPQHGREAKDSSPAERPARQIGSAPLVVVPDARTSSESPLRSLPSSPLRNWEEPRSGAEASSPTTSNTTPTHSHHSSQWSNPSLSDAVPTLRSDGTLALVPESELTTDVDVRLVHTVAGRLGVGRYSIVYLASYRPLNPTVANREDSESSGWQICAVKELMPDEESQRLGSREARVLRYLGADASVPHLGRCRVVSLLGFKRTSIPPPGAGHRSRSSFPDPDLLHVALDGHKSLAKHTRHSSLETDTRPIRYTGTVSLQSLSSIHPTELSRVLLVLPYAPIVLSTVIQRKPTLLTAQLYCKISVQLSQALAFIHSKDILHTDVKPQNVLLTRDLDVLLSDFNTAVYLPDTPNEIMPLDPIGLGTPVYSPPEFNRAPPSPFGYPADIWALGVTLMVAIVGREPYGRLSTGKRGKGHTGQELKMWLRKGAYWQWEYQERMENEATMHVHSDQMPRNETVETLTPHRIHWIENEQLQRLVPEVDVEVLRTSLLLAIVTGLNSELLIDQAESIDSLSQYTDGSAALFFLGNKSERVPDALYELLRGMCSATPSERPLIEGVISSLEEIQESLLVD